MLQDKRHVEARVLTDFVSVIKGETISEVFFVFACEFIASMTTKKSSQLLHCASCSASTVTVIHTTFYIPVIVGLSISTPERRERNTCDLSFGTACQHLIEYFEKESQTSKLYFSLRM